MLTTKNGQLAAVELLLAAGVNVNAKDMTNHTSLMFTAKGSHVDIVRALIEHGARVDAFADDNCNALILAVAKDHFEVAKLYSCLRRTALPQTRNCGTKQNHI